MFRHYVEMVKSWINVAANFSKTKHQQKNFPPVVAVLKKLMMTVASVLLDQFDQTLEKVSKTSLVTDMSILHIKGFNTHHFIKMIKRTKDLTTNTGQEKVKFLAYSSPVLRYIYY